MTACDVQDVLGAGSLGGTPSVVVEPKCVDVPVLVVGGGHLSSAQMGSSYYSWQVLFSGEPPAPPLLTFLFQNLRADGLPVLASSRKLGWEGGQ